MVRVMPPCRHDPPRGNCRLCYLAQTSAVYRRLWSKEPHRTACFHLGTVLSRENTNCPRCWKYACEIHGETTAEKCRHCPDWISDQVELP